MNGTSWYICKNGEWERISSITVDTQGWSKGKDGELRKGDSSDVIYKYEQAEAKWLLANERDSSLKLNGCTANRKGIVSKSSVDDTYYICTYEGSRTFSTYDNYYYNDDSYEWYRATEVEYNTYGKMCSDAEVGEIIDGSVTVSNKYYCTGAHWVNMTDWNWVVPKELRFNPEITYGSMTDSRDEKVYRTVKIGNQVWMAENLNYADSVKTPSLKGKSWCYDNEAENCAVAGRLYTWAAAIDSVALYDGGNGVDCGSGKSCTLPAKVQGICPNGWHLPSEGEWQALFSTAGGKSIADMMLILVSQTGWYDGMNGSDALGFSVLPAGVVDSHGGFYAAGNEACFWSATEMITDGYVYAYEVCLYKGTRYMGAYTNSKGGGFSIRCLQN